MSFLHPEFLYYLLPLLFILFGLLLTQQEAQADFFSKDVMEKLRVSANTLTIKARNALFFFMAILIVLALSAPVINDGEVEIKAKSSDIMIALDISDSMLAEDIYPNRLKFAKQKALDILNTTVDERIGIVAFAKNSYLVSPLSFDHSAVEFLLTQLNTDSITEKGTDFMSLLQVVANTSKNKKHLLILSDGGDKSDFSDEVEYAKENDIVVFILGIGTEKGSPIKLKNGEFIKQNGNIIVSKLNEDISILATKSGGVYIKSVKSDVDIKAMINEIKRKTESKELKSEKIKKYIPLFYYPLGLALVILLIATSSISKRQKAKISSLLVVFLFSFSSIEAEAGLLDFMELDKAKEAYKSGEFKDASEIYEKYADKTNNGESYFNAGNAFYKNKEYKKAIQSYKKASFNSKEVRAKNYANMGNAYVNGGKREDLLEAVKNYEKSLKIQQDKQIRENLEAVKKALKEQEKKKQDKKNKENQNKKDDKNKDSKENKDSDKSKKDNKKQENSKKDLKEKQQDKKEKKDSSKDADKKDKEEKSQASSKDKDKDKMSDAEEKKWLQRLNLQKNTYMYKLNSQKSKQENNDEKPW
ncbi:MAG: VWA domain-containing protein [Campylobacterota bacterium]|nr:VWA domain-containing protein [Campylobacterota bacterium]